MAELRSVPFPEGIGVANVLGGPFYDCPCGAAKRALLYGARTSSSACEWFRFQCSYFKPCYGVAELFSLLRQSNYELVLTHGDLSSLNVLVRRDEVVGIIDWETAGWFPSYWEYSSAKNSNYYNVVWAEEVDGYLTTMPHELEMDRIRRKYFGSI